MTGSRSLATALLKGYLRDRQAVFFTFVFPLMFLVLFGGIFPDEDAPAIEAVRVGDVRLLESMPPAAQTAFDEAFDVSETGDLDAAIEQVRDGDVAMAIEQRGRNIVVHYSEADQVQAAVAQGTLRSFVQAANIAASGQPPAFGFRSERVEDESLETIAFVTPGLLGWAIATSATFGPAVTLVGWRTTKLLRRIRLAPVHTEAVVAARIGVTLLVALLQMVVFIGLAVLVFDLRLTGSWWMAVPLLLCGALSFMAFGLLAGAVSTTVEGATNLVNIFVLPMAFLSGSFFPLDDAPAWLDFVSHLLPLRHLNEGMTDVMVRGQGPEAALVPMAILLGFGVVVAVIASRFFRWEAQ